MSQEPPLTPVEGEAAERELARRSRAGALGPWLIALVILLIAVAAFVLFARTG